MSSKAYECSKCLIRGIVTLSLQCGHFLCCRCIIKQAKLYQYTELSNIQHPIIVICQQCNITSQVKPQCISEALLNYQPNGRITQPWQIQECNGKMLFCLTCKDQYFNLQEFLAGAHKNHNVQSIDKAYPYIKEQLSILGAKLLKIIQQFYEKNESLVFKKKLLTENYASITLKIKTSFQYLRQLTHAKQKQILADFEQNAISQFEKIEQNLDISKEYISQCRMYEGWIKTNVGNEIMSQYSPASALRCINFYLQNFPKIEKYCSFKVDKIQSISVQPTQLKQFFIETGVYKTICQQIKQINFIQIKQQKNLDQKIKKHSEEENYFQRRKQEIFNSNQKKNQFQSPYALNQNSFAMKNTHTSINQKLRVMRQAFNLPTSPNNKSACSTHLKTYLKNNY